MKPIAIFYHCLFYHGTPAKLKPNAILVISEQMRQLQASHLAEAANEIFVGINGDGESKDIARTMLPEKATLVFQGLECHNECRTIRLLEDWLPTHPGWNVLYFHAKGCTHELNSPTAQMRSRWRGCMMKNLVQRWQKCVADLDRGYESVGCHWMTGKQTPPGQSIWAGNFWWATSDFLATLPSILLRERIGISGLDSAESRYESEVWIGNGPRLPRVLDYHGPDWNPGKVSTCVP